MTDTPEIARIRAALAAGPTPGPWYVQYGDDGNHMCMTAISSENKRSRNDGQFSGDEEFVAITLHQSYPFVDPDCLRDDATSEHIAACNPAAMTAVLAHIDAQAAEIERLLASLHKLASTVPALDGSGLFFFEHHGPDGEYLGCEYVDPMAVIQEMEAIARNAIDAVMKEQPCPSV